MFDSFRAYGPEAPVYNGQGCFLTTRKGTMPMKNFAEDAMVQKDVEKVLNSCCRKKNPPFSFFGERAPVNFESASNLLITVSATLNHGRSTQKKLL
ncbi:hypothetical protein [Paraflavitalea sp. CAU 1676]|uniref:hypothetical protein n=1 Tax=Paraflavitalea sp. CAU 1676 TaxID=3032598 RepID=UPI0023DC12CB|nr:hypothetical protein [Paraflavitalea sp. CAU 1676]MDF2188794.1 hypothetical protein [Paraflavitalea sp. CAU 1676]